MSSGHSPFTFAALMIGVQRAISLFTSAASRCWPRAALGGMSPPMSSRRLRTLGSSNALSMASLRRSRTDCGVPFGANNANQGDAWNSGSPASCEVGTFGIVGLRSAVPTANLERPGLNMGSGFRDAVAHVVNSTWPCQNF
jgi:hypothetical protein